MHPFFFYFQPEHFGIILTALLSYEYGDIPDFLRKTAKIEGVANISILLKKPEWGKGSASKFWGAKGRVRAFLDYLDYSGDPLDMSQSKTSGLPGNVVMESYYDETIRITILTQDRLYRIREHLGVERTLFQLLNMMLIDGMLKSIEFSFYRDGDEKRQTFSRLSEGEQQAIAIKGLTEFLADKNTLFLFDEPDTFLHPKWQRSFIGSIEDSIDSRDFVGTAFVQAQNSFVIATHSPQLLSSAKEDSTMVRIMERGKLIEKTPKHYGREIGAVLFEMMGVTDRPKEMTERLDNLFRLIDDEEFPRAEELYAELEQELGNDDADLVRARTLMELMKR